MGNISLSWDDPTTHQDGTAIAAGEFVGVKVEMRSKGDVVFKLLETVTPGGQGHATADLASGDYEFRVTPLDKDGSEGASASVMVTIADAVAPPPPPPPPKSPLSAVSNLKAVVT